MKNFDKNFLCCFRLRDRGVALTEHFQLKALPSTYMAASLAKSWPPLLAVVMPAIKRSFVSNEVSTKKISSRIPMPTGDQLRCL